MKIPVQSRKPALELISIRLYSTGNSGKRFTDHFYKARNHNFGVEIYIQNNTSYQQNVKIGGCVFDNSDSIVVRWNTVIFLNPHEGRKHDFYIRHDSFTKLHVGVYHIRFWINDKKMPIKYFEITNF